MRERDFSGRGNEEPEMRADGFLVRLTEDLDGEEHNVFRGHINDLLIDLYLAGVEDIVDHSHDPDIDIQQWARDFAVCVREELT